MQVLLSLDSPKRNSLYFQIFSSKFFDGVKFVLKASITKMINKETHFIKWHTEMTQK